MKAFCRGFILCVIYSLRGKLRRAEEDKPQMKIMRILCKWEFLEDQNGLQNITEVPATGKTLQDLYRWLTFFGYLFLGLVV